MTRPCKGVNNVTDALSTPEPKKRGPLERPPVSGPGSGTDEWRAFAAQETGRSVAELKKYDRAQLIALVDFTGPESDLREAPEGVDVVDEPRLKDINDRPQWAVPVQGGYAAEDEIRVAEREQERERVAERHRDRLDQLKQRG